MQSGLMDHTETMPHQSLGQTLAEHRSLDLETADVEATFIDHLHRMVGGIDYLLFPIAQATGASHD